MWVLRSFRKRYPEIASSKSALKYSDHFEWRKLYRAGEILDFLRFFMIHSYSQNKMAAEGKGLDFKSAKIQLKVTKSALTKASSEFETSCKDMEKNSDAAHTKKVRLAASVMENLENVNQRMKRMNDAHT